jgi:hypothetical protein
MLSNLKVVVVEFHLRCCSSRGAPGRTVNAPTQNGLAQLKGKHPQALLTLGHFS